ncbi:hypothetical protein RugamoR64_62090 [Duganella rhizosphaerae]|uniref:hypothetical protein n=1 Tax=Duganella rhizosphaerae TaxID=2885763 RepID=UPI0030E8FDE3
MKAGDSIYFLIDRFTEEIGTVVSFDEITGRVVVRADDDGKIFSGYEDQTRSDDDDYRRCKWQQ